MSLTELIQELEQQIGLFSKQYKTLDTKHHHIRTKDIPFRYKPAQQFLAQLSQTDINQDLIIKSFSPKDSAHELTISAQCINKLQNSAKLYVNTSLFPAGLYAKAMQEKTVTHQDVTQSDEAKIHWQNLAVGVCHAQIIYLLTHSIINKNGKSISTPATGQIKDDNPGILLLSSPRLKFKDGVATFLSKKQQKEYIEGMYRNLFQSTQREGRQYIAMPAAGLGSNGGSYTLYFSALMTVAKEFPELNVIYHPNTHDKEFDNALKKAKLHNVVKATKDIVVIADHLTQQGKLCALHNPSDTDVIYGLCDVGGLWKEEKNKHFTLQEYIGIMTTAPLNSMAFNAQAYQRIIEQHLNGQKVEIPSTQPSIPQPNPTSPDVPTPMPVPEIETETHQTQSMTDPISSPEPTPKMPPISTNSNGLFTPAPQNQERSSLSKEDIKAINKIIHCLQGEIDSFWPYPNKDVKQIKIDALNLLKIEVQTQSIAEAIQQVKLEYPRVTEGRISTRTSNFLATLEERANQMPVY